MEESSSPGVYLWCSVCTRLSSGETALPPAQFSLLWDLSALPKCILYVGLMASLDELVHLLFPPFSNSALPYCLQLALVLLTCAVSCSCFTKDYCVSVDRELLAPDIPTCRYPKENCSCVWTFENIIFTIFSGIF